MIESTTTVVHIPRGSNPEGHTVRVIVKRNDGAVFFIREDNEFLVYGMASEVKIQCALLGTMLCQDPLYVSVKISSSIDALRKRIKKDNLPAGVWDKVVETFIEPMRASLKMRPYGDDQHTYEVLI